MGEKEVAKHSQIGLKQSNILLVSYVAEISLYVKHIWFIGKWNWELD